MVPSTTSVIEATSSLVAATPPATSMIIVSVVSTSVLEATTTRIVVVKVTLASVVAAAKIVVSVTLVLSTPTILVVTIEAIISSTVVHLICISRLAIVEACWRLAATPAESASATLAHSLVSLLVLVVSRRGTSRVIESMVVLGSRIRLVFLPFVEGFWADLT